MASSRFQSYPVDSHSNSNKEEQYLFGFYCRINNCEVVASYMVCSTQGGSDRQFSVVRRLCLDTEDGGFYLDAELCFLTEAELKQLRETGKLSFPNGEHLQLVGPWIYDKKEEAKKGKEREEEVKEAEEAYDEEEDDDSEPRQR